MGNERCAVRREARRSGSSRTTISISCDPRPGKGAGAGAGNTGTRLHRKRAAARRLDDFYGGDERLKTGASMLSAVSRRRELRTARIAALAMLAALTAG